MQKRALPNHKATKRPLERSLPCSWKLRRDLFPHGRARESGTVCRMNAAVLLSQFVRGGIMSKFERLLEAGSTELPDCRCTAEMHPIAIVPVPGGISEIRIFRCPKCRHELRLTAWRGDVSAAA